LATQRPSIGGEPPGVVSAMAATQNAAIMIPTNGPARMTDLPSPSRRTPSVPAVVLLLIFLLLVMPMALVAIALGLGLRPLPYELFAVLQRLPLAFPLHMIASGAALILVPIAAFARPRRGIHRALGRMAAAAVVIGGLMHARPKFFAKVMGELLFWVGEDKMLFGSDYGIWEPKWQIDGFIDWDYPDPEHEEFSDYPRLGSDGKRKILGLNAAKLYGIEVPAELRLPDKAGTPAAKEDAQLVETA